MDEEKTFHKNSSTAFETFILCTEKYQSNTSACSSQVISSNRIFFKSQHNQKLMKERYPMN